MMKFDIQPAENQSDIIFVTDNLHYEISMAEESSLKLLFIALDGNHSVDVKIDMNGNNCRCELLGMYRLRGSQSVDFKIEMNHNHPHCFSNQLFKGIVDDTSRASFFGRIKVAQDAQKTEAYQATHNLVLSEDAVVSMLPQLEIYADDVKCSHGATVGKLNEDELFYLRSRGIPEKEARTMQQLAFLSEVLENMPCPERREEIEAALK